VLEPDRTEAGDLPWSDLGAHLAGLHRTSPPAGLPSHGAVERVRRAVDRLDQSPGPLRDLGRRLVREADAARPRHTGLVHGDWHLGQLTRMRGVWRLLDVDDLGVGDPAWDLARPAGFWAAGLLPDDAWGGFLAGYRAEGGPAVDPHGDPWPALDLPARCEVFIAACREQRRLHEGHSSPTADALLSACARM
jgi:aminoglycoside phosphotransferase (APT) family kinase protein